MNYTVAPLPFRLLASCCDFFFISLISIVLSLIFNINGIFLTQHAADNADVMTLALSASQIMYTMISIVYFAWCISSVHQSTLGQRLFKIKVISLSRDKIAFSLSLDRYLAQLAIPTVMKILGVLSLMLSSTLYDFLYLMIAPVLYVCDIGWYAMALYDDENATVHDKLFNTRVVKTV